MPSERFELPTLALQKPCTTTVLWWQTPPPGLEPGTGWLTVTCSTNWATGDCRVGGWIPVLPTKDGHYYSSKFYILAWDPTGKSILLSQQHHLCLITLSSYMPERLFSHSRVEPVDSTKILWHKKRGVSTPLLNQSSKTVTMHTQF